MRFVSRTWLAVAVAGVLGFPGLAPADVTFTFSDVIDPPDADPVPTAQVTYAPAGNQLTVTVNNTSAYNVRALYFNMDASVLDFVGPVSPEWTYEGNPFSQAVNAPGFGYFNYAIDFGFELLPAGSVTTFAVTLDGPASDASFLTLSNTADGGSPVLAAVTFQADPSSEVTSGTVFGGSVTTGGGSGEPNPVPAPAALPLFAAGLLLARRFGR